MNPDLAGPPLPSWFLLPATGIFAALTLYFIMRTRGARRPLPDVRMLVSLHVELTSRVHLPRGDSRREMGRARFARDPRHRRSRAREATHSSPRAFYPVALICGLMFVSAVINRIPMNAFEPITRFAIFVVIAVALWQALETSGSSVLRRLLFVFIQPLTYQIASIVLGVPEVGRTRRLAELHRRLLSRGTVLAHRSDLLLRRDLRGRARQVYARSRICTVALALDLPRELSNDDAGHPAARDDRRLHGASQSVRAEPARVRAGPDHRLPGSRCSASERRSQADRFSDLSAIRRHVAHQAARDLHLGGAPRSCPRGPTSGAITSTPMPTPRRCRR